MPNPFTVPDGGRAYTKTVIDKARLLIVKGIWDEIDELDFDRWLSNFKTDEEKYFSACLLDAYTFRSKRMCFSMMRDIFQNIVPNHCRELGINNFDSLSQWESNVSEGCSLVRFVPVNISDGKVKSSAVVARDFHEANQMMQRFIQQPENIDRAIDNGTKLIVFLDDIAGSGHQFNKFVSQQNLQQYKNDVNFLYTPLAGHEDALERIHNKNSYIAVKPVDKLSKKDNFFFPAEDETFRGDGVNHVDSAIAFYDSIFGPGKPIKYRYGMNKQGLTYSFHFSTPNNNLKALFHEEVGCWRRLVFRGES